MLPAAAVALVVSEPHCHNSADGVVCVCVCACVRVCVCVHLAGTLVLRLVWATLLVTWRFGGCLAALLALCLTPALRSLLPSSACFVGIIQACHNCGYTCLRHLLLRS